MRIKNIFGNDVQANPFADLADKDQTLKMEEIYLKDKSATQETTQQQYVKFGGPNAPIWDEKLPPRRGPLLWWMKTKEDLGPAEYWHRHHRMSPAVGESEIEALRTSVVTKEPSHGKSTHWYEDSL